MNESTEAAFVSLNDVDRNISHCWRCSHCKWVPSPVSNEFAHACPSIQWGGFHSYSGGGKVITAHALKSGEAGYTAKALETIYACSMCGACDTSCKNNNGELVEPLEVLYALRAHVAIQGHSLPAHRQIVEHLRQHGNPMGKPRNERSAWSRGLKLKDALRDSTAVLLHIGCENAYEPGMWPELHAIVRLLVAAGVDFSIAYDRECATGEVAHDIGFHDDARALALAMREVIIASKARTVVTCSAGGYSAFRNVWPRLGVDLPCEVLHITEYIEKLFAMGKLTADQHCDMKVTYHDPCKLGRLGERYERHAASRSDWVTVSNIMPMREHKRVYFGNGGVYEAPRALLAQVPGVQLVEMERNRVSSYCCGAGGGAPEAVPEFAEAAARNRLAEAKATGATVVATACGSCRQHLDNVTRAGGEQLRVMGVFEIVAAAVTQNHSTGTGEE